MTNKLMTVEWLDAREFNLEKEEFDRMLTSKDGREYLAIKKTYGLIYKLKNTVMVVMEESDDGTREITAIPREWIVKIF